MGESTTVQAELAEVFKSLGNVLAFDPRDWGQNKRDAWLYAVLLGWDCEQAHEHDDICEDGAAMAEIAARHRWTVEDVARLRRYRAAVRQAAGPPQPPGV